MDMDDQSKIKPNEHPSGRSYKNDRLSGSQSCRPRQKVLSLVVGASSEHTKQKKHCGAVTTLAKREDVHHKDGKRQEKPRGVHLRIGPPQRDATRYPTRYQTSWHDSVACCLLFVAARGLIIVPHRGVLASFVCNLLSMFPSSSTQMTCFMQISDHGLRMY